MNSLVKTFVLVIFFTWLALFVTACDNQGSQVDDKENKNTPSKTVSAEELYDDGQTYVEGGDYNALQTPYDTENKEQVVVYEFFSYACSHCFTFEPYLNKWLENKPDYVKLVRVPMKFQPSWAKYQRAYLTAEVMGIVEQTHSKLFTVIHKTKQKRFNSLEELAQWYADTTGVDKEAFLSTSNSFILESKLRKADNMGLKMQITSTPTLIINGKYKAAKGMNRNETMEILDFLIDKEARLMGLID